MSAAKYGIAGVFGLAGLGALGVAFSAAGAVSADQKLPSLPAVSMRAYPGPLNVTGPAAPAPTAVAKVEPVVAPPPTPAAVVDAGAPKVEPKVEAPKVEPKVEAPKVEPKVEAPKVEPKVEAPKVEPKVEAPKVEPKVEAPKPPKVEAPKVEAAPVAEGTLNLMASDTADVFVDGKKIGQSPQPGFKVKAGPHKVRFDCYDTSGNAQKGELQIVTVKADQELPVEYTCQTE